MTKRTMIVWLVVLSGFVHSKLVAQVMETEQSEPLVPGQVHLEAGFEWQLSADGSEFSCPLGAEFGINKHLTLLVEPIAFTRIHPDSGTGASGLGDMEITLFYQVVSQKKALPSISISGELKVPTARNMQLGTTKFDYTPFLIISEVTGRFVTSANFGYTFLGKPNSAVANNFIDYRIGTIFTSSHEGIIFGEVFGNSSAFNPEDHPEVLGTLPKSTIFANSEFENGQIVFSIGYGYELQSGLILSLGVSHDDKDAFLFRGGIEWESGKRKTKTAYPEGKEGKDE